jgi:hypothetical protein
LSDQLGEGRSQTAFSPDGQRRTFNDDRGHKRVRSGASHA